MRNRTMAIALAGLVVCGMASTPSLHAEQSAQTPQEPSGATITKILRGKTVCTGILYRDQICGIEHWSVYVHQDGFRTMHVASETMRNEEVRHALIIVSADGRPHEAFMHNRAKTGAIGSSFAVLSDGSVETAVNDSGFGSDKKTIAIANVEKSASVDSLSTGPASADGLLFLKYDFEAAGEQPRNIYWKGVPRQDQWNRLG